MIVRLRRGPSWRIHDFNGISARRHARRGQGEDRLRFQGCKRSQADGVDAVIVQSLRCRSIEYRLLYTPYRNCSIVQIVNPISVFVSAVCYNQELTKLLRLVLHLLVLDSLALSKDTHAHLVDKGTTEVGTVHEEREDRSCQIGIRFGQCQSR